MQCPNCKVSLEPKELEVGLLAASCPQCDGSLLPLMNYRYWQDNQHEVSEHVDDVVEDSAGAKLCPKCSKIMLKFKLGVESENRLELCAHCDEIWLDRGEWSLIKKLNIHECLPNVFTEAWQRNLRKQREAQRLKSYYSERLGEAEFAKVEEFKQWLDVQENKGDITHYLSINFDY